ncbi:hypothetical protein EA736_17505 [Acinetobacter baumannii]|uniref:hypothetical protein n=1 Tax=Acinetobacter calcoaceticus/baumannii complex TaxID=909768 RepID=UPI000165E6A1|nr:MULTISPECIES: hypothetical protein [Acinetobacter calcoaceticus/baumannii complex]EKV6547590.1 hypothetical protein [Acinetobacter baumannii]ELB0409899.1 hypothetical protein [Acinetobacter baumannii]EMD2134561.1 hypothetical protein [Acinetobacter baumannii]ENW35965.1 hypothetical protein F921_02720 [Acinetobacter baumannii NIPH 527]KIQ71753.1 hypothetical protein SE99_03462 [Acinetobacter baumannii]
MPFERKTGYKLKFINENDFEIICLDCNDTNSVRQQLKDAGFVTDIKTVDEKDKNHLQKIIGVTSSKEDLISLLDDWFDLLDSIEVTAYKDFD